MHRATSTPLAADRVRRQEHVRGTKLRGLPRRSARGGILAGLVATLTACATLAAPALAFTPTFETQFNAGFGGDQVGFASAIQGNTIAVGCPWADIRTSTPHGIAITKDKGGVDVYQFDGSYWVRKGRFVGTRLNDAENVGFSVGISEDTIVAGAPSADVNGHVNQGAAYVFAKSGTSWGAQPQQLSAADGTAEDHFGASVAVSGDVIVVGADRAHVGANQDQGKVYAFVRTAMGWRLEATLRDPNGSPSDFFGAAVALSGSTAIVGAPQADAPGGVDQGAVFVFSRLRTSSGMQWRLEKKLSAADAKTGDYFGSSLAAVGDTAVVGAMRKDGVAADEGAAYVLSRKADGWSQDKKLTAPSPAVGDLFGSSVAVYGGVVMVGAYGHDFPGTPTRGLKVDQGAAYVYRHLDGGWSDALLVAAEDGAAGDQFGRSVAISGQRAIVGAPLDDSTRGLDQGCAYVLMGLDATPPTIGVAGADALWHNKPVTLTITASDEQYGSGLAYTEYMIDSGRWLIGNTVTVGPSDGDGEHTVSCRSVDLAGNQATASVKVRIDTTPPAGSFALNDGASSTTSANVSVDSAVTDTVGVSEMRFSTDEKATWGSWMPFSTTASLTLSPQQGLKTVYAEYRDEAGNVVQLWDDITLDENTDTSPPSTKVSGVVADKWYKAAVSVAFTSTDEAGGSGIAYVEYKLDDAAWVRAASLSVALEGSHILLYRAADVAGNLETTKELNFGIDTGKPVTKALSGASARRGSKATLKYRVLDPVPNGGTAAVTIKIKNRAGKVIRTLKPGVQSVNTDAPLVAKLRVPRTWAKGTYQFLVYASDTAGNASKSIGANKLVVR